MLTLKEITGKRLDRLSIKDLVELCKRHCVYAVVNAGTLIGFLPEQYEGSA
ncbi:MAG: hypothetical protein FWB91_00325 [Defluviitaleaceae bacterium]|nr:hypothetical protein [Defluviitaleaceae bacterium]